MDKAREGAEECCRPATTLAHICRRAIRLHLPGDEQIADLKTAAWKPRGGSPSEMHLVQVDTLRSGRPCRSFSLVWKQTTAREALATATVAARLPELLPTLISHSLDPQANKPEALHSWILTEFREGRSAREGIASAGGDVEAVCRLAQLLASLHRIDAACLGAFGALIPRADMAGFVHYLLQFLTKLVASPVVSAEVETHCPALPSGLWVREMEALAERPHVFTHSDLSWGNLLATDHGLLAVDWGLARWFPAGIDLAIWLEPLSPEIAARALHAYVSARGERANAREVRLEFERCRLYHALTRLEGLAESADLLSLARLLQNVASALQGISRARG